MWCLQLCSVVGGFESGNWQMWILDSGCSRENALRGPSWEAERLDERLLQENRVSLNPAKVKVIGMRKGEQTWERLRQLDIEKWGWLNRVVKSREISRMILSFLTWSDGLALLLSLGLETQGREQISFFWWRNYAFSFGFCLFFRCNYFFFLAHLAASTVFFF